MGFLEVGWPPDHVNAKVHDMPSEKGELIGTFLENFSPGLVPTCAPWLAPIIIGAKFHGDAHAEASVHSVSGTTSVRRLPARCRPNLMMNTSKPSPTMKPMLTR